MTERDIQNDILRRAAQIMASLEKKYDKYFTHRGDLTIETAIELEEARECHCGHMRWEHYLGRNSSPQCKRCRCDRYDP